MTEPPGAQAHEEFADLNGVVVEQEFEVCGTEQRHDLSLAAMQAGQLLPCQDAGLTANGEHAVLCVQSLQQCIEPALWHGLLAVIPNQLGNLNRRRIADQLLQLRQAIHGTAGSVALSTVADRSPNSMLDVTGVAADVAD